MHSCKFIVSHIAARRDYDVARVLYENNMLDKLFIDAYYNPSKMKIFNILDKIIPKNIVKTYQRYQPKINHEVIDYDWYLGLKYRTELMINSGKNCFFPKVSAYQSLNKNVLSYTKKAKHVSSYYGFDTASLEFFQWAAMRNWFLVLEQCIAPRASLIQMYKLLEAKFCLKANHQIDECKGMREREENEWALASVIIAPSNFVKDELIAAGAPIEKIRLVPFGYNSPNINKNINEKITMRFGRKKQPMRVLFAGNAGFRKGIQDLLIIAKELEKENVEFIVAGNVEDNCKNLIHSARLRNVYFLGKLNIYDLHKEYAQADIFLFPSYMEGSAMVLFEAMSWGLPLIVTYQSGSVITHENEGFLCEAGDTQKMKDYVTQLLYKPELRYKMSYNALDTSKKFTLNQYRSHLLKVLSEKEVSIA